MSVSQTPLSQCRLVTVISNGWQERIERLPFMTLYAANITAPCGPSFDAGQGRLILIQWSTERKRTGIKKTTSARTGGTPERVACSKRVVIYIGLHAARITQIQKRNVVWCDKKMDWEMGGIAREARGYSCGYGTWQAQTGCCASTGVVSMRLSKVQQKQ